jgi:hypothetical protein
MIEPKDPLMKRPTPFQYSAAAIIGLTVASVLWFARTPARVETSAGPADQAQATRPARPAAAGTEDPVRGKPRIRDASQTAPGVEVVRLTPDQVLATVNKEPIQLRHLMPVGEDEAENVLTPEEYGSRLQRAIDIEVVFQAARDAGVGLTEAQQKRRDAIDAGSQAELAHYQKHGLSWSTAGPGQVEFEKRLLSARMLEQNLVAKASTLNPSPDPAIQSRYELARLDLLKQLHAVASVAITSPSTGP